MGPHRLPPHQPGQPAGALWLLLAAACCCCCCCCLLLLLLLLLVWASGCVLALIRSAAAVEHVNRRSTQTLPALPTPNQTNQPKSNTRQPPNNPLQEAMRRTRKLCAIVLDTLGREVMIRRPFRWVGVGAGVVFQYANHSVLRPHIST